MPMKRLAIRRLGQQRGQAIILFVFLFTIIAVIGAIAVDFGIWFSERRGAQTDSDLISLAGAYELLDSSAEFADVDVATQDSSFDNGVDPVEDLQNLQVRSLEFPDGYETDLDYCHTAPDTGGRLNTVVLDVEHDSRALFAGIFGIPAPDIGAHACARAGSLINTQGLRPWAVSMTQSPCFEWSDELQNYEPLFMATCPIRVEDPPSQLRSIGLGDEPGDDCGDGSGASVYRENIEDGADAVCSIGDIITSESGRMAGPTATALATLLSTEGECDEQNSSGPPDGIDQLLEAFDPSSDVPSSTVTFVAKDCVTPRFVHIVVTDEFQGTGRIELTIIGFAGFFIDGCRVVETNELVENCDLASNVHEFEIEGRFMRIVELEGDIGAFDPFGTHVIRLAE